MPLPSMDTKYLTNFLVDLLNIPSPTGFTEDQQSDFAFQSRRALIAVGAILAITAVAYGVATPRIALTLSEEAALAETEPDKPLPPATPEEYAANWPAFRGPDGSGR